VPRATPPIDVNSLFSDPGLRRDRAELAEHWRKQGLHSEATLPGELARAAREDPDLRIVLHSSEHPASIALADLHRDALAMAGAFARAGIGPGDVVAVQLPNWAQTALAYTALATLGAIFVPIVHIYGPKETDWILRASGARMLLCPDRWGKLDFLERLRRMPSVADLQVVIVGDDVPSGAMAWRELGEQRDPGFSPEARLADDPLLIVYTSGTTSDPKGVIHSHATFLAELRNMPQLPVGARDQVTLQPWPAGHIGGLCALLGPIVTRTQSIVMDRWDAEDAAALIAQYSVTSLCATPFHVMGLLDMKEAGDPRFDTLQDLVSGGAGVPPAMVERAHEVGWCVRRAYGSTEHPTASCGRSDSPVGERATTDGAPCPNSEVRIALEDGREAPLGQPGEIWLRGPEQFVGYTDPLRNAEAFAAGGWFRTGDVGVMDAAGNLAVTDRLKDLIIRGGENLSSLEIENLLQCHPAIAEAAAVGYPDERYGERVCAFVVPAAGHEAPGIPELIVHFEELGVAKQKTPERIVSVAEFPRTASGKIKKNELRERL
jgi:acyl-CoA synthetase (AMP-forming)/AMP-acid ligase II